MGSISDPGKYDDEHPIKCKDCKDSGWVVPMPIAKGFPCPKCKGVGHHRQQASALIRAREEGKKLRETLGDPLPEPPEGLVEETMARVEDNAARRKKREEFLAGYFSWCDEDEITEEERRAASVAYDAGWSASRKVYEKFKVELEEFKRESFDVSCENCKGSGRRCVKCAGKMKAKLEGR